MSRPSCHNLVSVWKWSVCAADRWRSHDVYPTNTCPLPSPPTPPPLQEQCGSYTFIPYVVSPQGKVFACNTAMIAGIKELMQPSFQLEPLLTLLVEQLVHLLNNVHIQSRSVRRSADSQSVATSKT